MPPCGLLHVTEIFYEVMSVSDDEAYMDQLVDKFCLTGDGQHPPFWHISPQSHPLRMLLATWCATTVLEYGEVCSIPPASSISSNTHLPGALSRDQTSDFNPYVPIAYAQDHTPH